MPTSSFLLSLASLHTATYVLALRRFFSLDLRRFLLSQAIDLGFVKVSAMLPKFRTSKRKAFFRTPENLQPELTGHETAAPSHCYENEGASGSNHSKKNKLCDQYNPDCIDVCHMNESVPVTSSVSYGQALYQRSRQGLITDYEDSGDSSFGCGHCGAYFWKGEALANSIRTNSTVPIYTRCCQKGEIQIPLSDSTPPFLQQLLDPNNGRRSIFFRENIRVYNSMFAFTSMGAKIDYDLNRRSGPYVFKICGQIHHLMGSALPVEGERPKYAQLYIYDTNNEVSNRMDAIDPCQEGNKMVVTPVIAMVPNQYKYTIRVRVSRLWRPRFNNTDAYNGLHYVLVDEDGDSIHAFINEDQHDDYIKKVQQGQVYEICLFTTHLADPRASRVLHNDMVVHFHGPTEFVRIDDAPPIPQQSFQLIEFEDLEIERQNKEALTDIYGCIKAVRTPHEQPLQTTKKAVTKCEVIVHNLIRETLKITLWGDTRNHSMWKPCRN